MKQNLQYVVHSNTYYPLLWEKRHGNERNRKLTDVNCSRDAKKVFGTKRTLYKLKIESGDVNILKIKLFEKRSDGKIHIKKLIRKINVAKYIKD